MASEFGADLEPITLCLRDASDHLVTKHNLALKVRSGEKLRLCPSPAIEALHVTAALRRELLSGTSASALAFRVEEESRNGMRSMEERDEVLKQEQLGAKVPLKLAMFNVQKYIQEAEFAVDFMLKDGVRMLVGLMDGDRLPPNTLAYALQGMRGLLEYEASWTDITLAFVDRIIMWISSSTAPNILRPATAILRKIFMSTLSASSLSQLPTAGGATIGKGKARASTPTGQEALRFGFEDMCARIEHVGMELQGGAGGNGGAGVSEMGSMRTLKGGAEYVWRVVVKRLEGTGDLELVAQSLGLINAALKAGQDVGGQGYEQLVSLVESLGVRKLVARLIPVTTTETLERAIHAFQSRYAGILQHRRLTPVDPTRNAEHERLLRDIWTVARLGESLNGTHVRGEGYEGHSGPRYEEGWRRMGLVRDDHDQQDQGAAEGGEGEMFRAVGVLGLECLHYGVTHEEDIASTLAEQQAKPADRQCPYGTAVLECVKILCEHYKISSAALRPPTQYQAFLLLFTRLVQLSTSFFLRMWQESEATTADFYRVSHLVRSQLTVSLVDEGNKTWLTLEQELLEGEYRDMRERQMDWIEQEDGVMSSYAVRTLRGTVRDDALEVVREQRMGCLLRGAWFNAAVPIDKSRGGRREPDPAKPMRFVRLTPNGRSLLWSDFKTWTKIPPPNDVLIKKVDAQSIADIHTTTAHAVNSRSPGQASKMSFTIVNRHGESLLDLDAIHAEQRAEWVDGLGALMGRGEMKSVESEAYVKILTDLGVKIRLLDITGDGLEIPSKLEMNRAPMDDDFWFADQ